MYVHSKEKLRECTLCVEGIDEGWKCKVFLRNIHIFAGSLISFWQRSDIRLCISNAVQTPDHRRTIIKKEDEGKEIRHILTLKWLRYESRY